MIGRKRLKPDDPPPDLAIETNVTSQTTLGAYTAIGIPELWIFDTNRLSIYVLEQGQYVEVETSPTFSEQPLKTLIPETVARSWQVGSSQALEELEARLKA
jgi:Uma2 family endonuclease